MESKDQVQEEFVSKEDLLNLQLAEMRKSLAQSSIEKAQLALQASELVYQNLLLQMGLKYCLGPEDKFASDTGKITRKV